MATASPNTPATEGLPKTPFRKSPFTIVDLSGGSVSRQIRVDKETYEKVELLALQLKKVYAADLGSHRLTLEEVLVLAVQAGTVALTADPHASRRLP